ncbi:hypothetical protein JKP88DRAFT_190760, partial [Tribonema minus]
MPWLLRCARAQCRRRVCAYIALGCARLCAYVHNGNADVRRRYSCRHELAAHATYSNHDMNDACFSKEVLCAHRAAHGLKHGMVA